MPFLAIPAVATAVAGGAAAGASIYGSHAAGKASSNATRAQVDSANRAAELEAQSAREALDFAKQQEEQRRKEFEETQAKNYELFLQKRGDLAPYRNLGSASVGQLSQPIPRWQQAGTLGQRMGGQ